MVRLVDQDEEYGTLGLGRMVLAGADTFGVVSIDDLIEPTLIYDIKVSNNKIQTEIFEILVWDVREWLPKSVDDPPSADLETDYTAARGGIARDNTLNKSGFPASEADVNPDNNTTAVVGAVSGTLGVTTGSVVPRNDAQWEFGSIVSDAIAADGNVVGEIRRLPENRVVYSPYGHNPSRHHMLLHANYYQWFNTDNYTAVADQALGMDARLMSIDLEEVLADRGVILNLADALTILTI